MKPKFQLNENAIETHNLKISAKNQMLAPLHNKKRNSDQVQ